MISATGPSKAYSIGGSRDPGASSTWRTGHDHLDRSAGDSRVATRRLAASSTTERIERRSGSSPSNSAFSSRKNAVISPEAEAQRVDRIDPRPLRCGAPETLLAEVNVAESLDVNARRLKPQVRR